MRHLPTSETASSNQFRSYLDQLYCLTFSVCQFEPRPRSPGIISRFCVQALFQSSDCKSLQPSSPRCSIAILSHSFSTFHVFSIFWHSISPRRPPNNSIRRPRRLSVLDLVDHRLIAYALFVESFKFLIMSPFHLSAILCATLSRYRSCVRVLSVCSVHCTGHYWLRHRMRLCIIHLLFSCLFFNFPFTGSLFCSPVI